MSVTRRACPTRVGSDSTWRTEELRHGDPASRGFRPRGASCHGARQLRRRPDAAASRVGRDPGRRDAHRGGPDRRRDAADRAGLGDQAERARPRRPDRPQGARPAASPRRHASRGPGGGGRERADPGHARRGALAGDRPAPVAARRVPGECVRADAEPRTARARISQAVRTPAPPCPGRRRDRGF